MIKDDSVIVTMKFFVGRRKFFRRFFVGFVGPLPQYQKFVVASEKTALGLQFKSFLITFIRSLEEDKIQIDKERTDEKLDALIDDLRSIRRWPSS